MALGDIYLRPCGRPGTWRHLLLFCVAGVLQVHLVARLVAVGRRAAALSVAGMALGDIYLRFMW